MSNPYGIFASTIASNYNHGTDRIRAIVTSDAQAERILSAAVLTVAMQTGESAEVIEGAIRQTAANCYVRTRPAVKLAWAALAEVESAFTVTRRISGAGEGFESAAPIHDCRRGGEMAEALLMVG